MSRARGAAGATQCESAAYDGTPNESVADVLVRARQVLSITETQYDEEFIIFIAPDSNVLSVLQAALLGIDLRDHWGLAFRCDPRLLLPPVVPRMFCAVA